MKRPKTPGTSALTACLGRAAPLLAIGLAAGFLSLPAGAQSTPLVSPPVQPDQAYNPALAQPAVPDSFRVGPNDLLSVFVLKMPDMTRQLRVGSDGTIQLPLLSRPLPASGLTAQQIAHEVSVALQRQQLAVAPTVQVTVQEVRSRPIVVSGAVAKPTVIQAVRPMHLLEVLSLAGGLDKDAGTNVLVSRPGASGTTTTTIDLEQLTEDNDESVNPLLDGNDVIRVLPAKQVYVIGAFQKPGAFPVQAGQPVTVLEAIALAQGFSNTDPADKKHAKIIQPSVDGSAPTAIPVNIDKMLKREVPDRRLAAGDILYVPVNGRHKALTEVLRDAGQIVVLGVGYNAAGIF